MRLRGLGWIGTAALAAVFALAISCQGDGDQPVDAAPPTSTATQAASPSAAATQAATASTAATQAATVAAAAAPSGTRDARLGAVRSWAYQLQGAAGASLSLGPLVASDFDLFVIDYSRDGDDEGAFTRSEIAALQASGRIVLAYMSIGEAESYRFYWDERWAPDGEPGDDAPGWVGPTNEAWEGNFKVRYWEDGWQRLILGAPGQRGYLDRVIDAGFDGVYLDIIDGYEFLEPEREDAAALMATFVGRIAAHARLQRGVPGFLVFPQNGAAILDALDGEERERYLAAVDGIGAEDTFYFGDDDEDNALDVQQETLELLRIFRDRGLLVLAVDYLTDAQKAADFCARAAAEGFVPATAPRALDALSSQPCTP